MNLWTTAALVAFVGCSDPTTEARIQELENRIEALQANAPKPPASNEDEVAAGQLLQAAVKSLDAGDSTGAKKSLEQLTTKYGNTRAAKRAASMTAEVAVYGKDAVPLDVEKWFQGSAADADGKATLVVFWEKWCPHCKREVPKLQALHEQYSNKGLAIVGLTKMTKGVTEADVTSFIQEQQIDYPMALESGTTISDYYAIRGIPAAVAIKDGKVVWRGHPGRIGQPLIERWLSDS
ncbi:MAG: redoxin domain-containing protein [Myxococcota bacterium]